MLNFYGEQVEKPKGFYHSPSIDYSIVPAQRVPFSLWGEVIRAELNQIVLGKQSDVEDCELIKVHTLKQ